MTLSNPNPTPDLNQPVSDAKGKAVKGYPKMSDVDLWSKVSVR